MSNAPTVILHTDRPAPALAVLTAAHPDLTVHGCDSYAGLPALIEETRAEIVYSVRFDGTPRFPRARRSSTARRSNGCRSAGRARTISGAGTRPG